MVQNQNILRKDFNSTLHVARNMLDIIWRSINKNRHLSAMTQHFYTLQTVEDRAYYLQQLIKEFSAELGVRASVSFAKNDTYHKNTLSTANATSNKIFFFENLLQTPDLAEYLATAARGLYNIAKESPDVLTKLEKASVKIPKPEYQTEWYVSAEYQRDYGVYLDRQHNDPDRQQANMKGIFVQRYIKDTLYKKSLHPDMAVPQWYLFDAREGNIGEIEYNPDIAENAGILGQIKARLSSDGVPEVATVPELLKILKEKREYPLKIYKLDPESRKIYHEDIVIEVSDRITNNVVKSRFDNLYSVDVVDIPATWIFKYSQASNDARNIHTYIAQDNSKPVRTEVSAPPQKTNNFGRYFTIAVFSVIASAAITYYFTNSNNETVLPNSNGNDLFGLQGQLRQANDTIDSKEEQILFWKNRADELEKKQNVSGGDDDDLLKKYGVNSYAGVIAKIVALRNAKFPNMSDQEIKQAYLDAAISYARMGNVEKANSNLSVAKNIYNAIEEEMEEALYAIFKASKQLSSSSNNNNR